MIVTSYNLYDYMERCLEELLHQTFQDFHILIVDDDSQDGTQDIIRRYARQYPQRITAHCL